MKQFKNVILLISITILSSGCTTSNMRDMLGHAIADGADTKVKYNPHQCSVLRQQCVQGDFQEWQTSDKEMGCSCKKL